MKNRVWIAFLSLMFLFVLFSIYLTYGKILQEKKNLTLINEEYEAFKLKDTSYNYEQIVSFSNENPGINLKWIKNVDDNIIVSFNFEGELTYLDDFLSKLSKIGNLKGIKNISLEKDIYNIYKGEIASEFITKSN